MASRDVSVARRWSVPTGEEFILEEKIVEAVVV